MKNIFQLLLIIFIYSCTSSKKTSYSKKEEYDFVGKWRIDNILGYDGSLNIFTISTTEDIYGNFIVFNQDLTFKSFYSASCGNDCFTKAKGTYKVKKDIIEFYIIETYRKGMCENKSSKPNKILGKFKILKEKNSIVFSKIK
jgi:hypothetical protein